MVSAMGQFIPPVDRNPVMVCLDLTERSDPCIARGCEMARKFDRPLVLAHVVHEGAETAGMYRRHQQIKDTTPLRDIAFAMLQDQVAAFRATCDGLDRVCDIQLAVVEGLPKTRIPELASYYDASMIVMCSHNRHGLGRWLYGSVTETVVRRATCPVVVVGQDEGESIPHTFHRPLAPAPGAVEGS